MFKPSTLSSLLTRPQSLVADEKKVRTLYYFCSNNCMFLSVLSLNVHIDGRSTWIAH